MKVHHIGYLVKDLLKARDSFLGLGYADTSGIVADEGRGISLCFLSKDGYTVELVTPSGVDSAVSGLIGRYRNAPYHLCYASDAFDEDLARLEESGYTRMDDPAPAPAFAGRRVVFLMSPVIGIIELLEHFI